METQILLDLGIAFTEPTSAPVTNTKKPCKHDWIKAAIARSKTKKREFCTYGKTSYHTPYVPPDWLTKRDPKPPVLPLRQRQPPNPHTQAMFRWYREWRNRDWEELHEFYRVTDPDYEPNQQIIRIAA